MSNNRKDKLISLRILLGGLIVLFVIVGGYSLFLYQSVFGGELSNTQGSWGEFGDFVGGVTGTIVNLIAVVLVYLTYRVQSLEVERTNEVLTVQTEKMEAELHQNVMFNLLEIRNRSMSEVSYKQRTGLHAVWKLLNIFEKDVSSGRDRDEALKDRIGNYRNTFIPYYRSFTSGLLYLDGVEVKSSQMEKIKRQLIELYATNLSNTEVKLLNRLFEYYSINNPDNERINMCRRLVKKWNAFKLSEQNLVFIGNDSA